MPPRRHEGRIKGYQGQLGGTHASLYEVSYPPISVGADASWVIEQLKTRNGRARVMLTNKSVGPRHATYMYAITAVKGSGTRYVRSGHAYLTLTVDRETGEVVSWSR